MISACDVETDKKSSVLRAISMKELGLNMRKYAWVVVALRVSKSGKVLLGPFKIVVAAGWVTVKVSH